VPGHRAVLNQKRPIIANDFPDVLAGFVDRWEPAIAIHGMFPGIVGCKGQRKVSPESIQQLAQVFRSPPDIIFRIIEVPHFEANGRLWHQLHQPNGAGSRYGHWVEAGFRFNDSPDKGGM